MAANAGWYMMPDLAADFPYGLKGTPVSADDLRHALGLPLVVLLGTADTNARDKVLRHTPQADAQGLYRFARGQFFFARAAAAARAQGRLPLAAGDGPGHRTLRPRHGAVCRPLAAFRPMTAPPPPSPPS